MIERTVFVLCSKKRAIVAKYRGRVKSQCNDEKLSAPSWSVLLPSQSVKCSGFPLRLRLCTDTLLLPPLATRQVSAVLSETSRDPQPGVLVPLVNFVELPFDTKSLEHASIA